MKQTISDKEEKYQLLIKQVGSIMEGVDDMISNMANVAALIHNTFGFWWTGFYRVIDHELRLGPFQGPVACTHIPYGRGVCGKAWEAGQSIVVDDVETFPGHIACSSRSRSEIVVPLVRNGDVVAVLDIDSENLATFDDTDRHYLELIAEQMVR